MINKNDRIIKTIYAQPILTTIFPSMAMSGKKLYDSMKRLKITISEVDVKYILLGNKEKKKRGQIKIKQNWPFQDDQAELIIITPGLLGFK